MRSKNQVDHEPENCVLEKTTSFHWNVGWKITGKGQLRVSGTSLLWSPPIYSYHLPCRARPLRQVKFPTYGQRGCMLWYYLGNAFGKTWTFNCPIRTQKMVVYYVSFTILRKENCLACTVQALLNLWLLSLFLFSKMWSNCFHFI